MSAHMASRKRRWFGVEDDALGAVVDQKMAALGTGDHRHADLLREFEPLLRDPGARQQHRDAHLRDLDDHLRRQPTGGVEDLVGAVDAVEPHMAGDGVSGVVAADVFDEQLDGGGARPGHAQRATMHRAGAAVDLVLGAQGVEQGIDV